MYISHFFNKWKFELTKHNFSEGVGLGWPQRDTFTYSDLCRDPQRMKDAGWGSKREKENHPKLQWIFSKNKHRKNTNIFLKITELMQLSLMQDSVFCLCLCLSLSLWKCMSSEIYQLVLLCEMKIKSNVALGGESMDY